MPESDQHDAGPGLLNSLQAKQEATDAEKRAVLTALARKTFLSPVTRDFCDHVWVQDPNTQRILRYEKWKHLVTMADMLMRHRLVIIGKDRQVGVSETIAAYVLWTAMKGNAVIPLLSQGGVESQKLLGKVKFIHANLPPYLQLPFEGDWGMERVRFKNGSSIEAYPSTEKAGRSITGTLVVFDEADFHEYLAQNYNAIKPTIDMGGQLVMISTINPDTVESIFKTLLKGARDYAPERVAA